MENKVIVQKVQEIEKVEEFETFLDFIKKGKIEHWQNIAEAIGIHRNTIARWREHPKAREAIIEGIRHSLEEMERVGNRDWKMWREKLKMLGITEEVTTQVAVGVNVPVTIEGKEVSDEQLARRVIGIIERLKSIREGRNGKDNGGSGQSASSEGDSEGK